MLGSLIGAGLSIGGAIFGGHSASKAMKRMKQNIETQRQKNEDWYNRRYNEDATQRADAQRILTMTADRMKSANRNAAGSAAVMGGTEESVAATKAANAQAMADAASQIAAAGDRRKDAIEQQYQRNEQGYQNQLNQMEAGKAQAIGQAVQGITQAGAGIATSLDDAFPNLFKKSGGAGDAKTV